jgi:hypothetical protein
MVDYDNWAIGTEVIPHVREAKINTQDGIITLECSALKDNIATGDNDPRDEITRFQNLTSQFITNTPLLNGGSKLQYGNGQTLSVTDGTDTYDKCCLARVEINEDHTSTKRIDYTLTINYEMSSTGGSYVYTPRFNKADYTNIVYYYFYDPGPPEVFSNTGSGDLHGTEIGWMQITETQNVVRVEVYGCGCDVPGSKIYVNDVERIWHYGEVLDTPYADGTEKLTWDLATPTTTITIKTTHHEGPPTYTPNYGAWLQWIKVYYE